jgi:hypothetical protein
MLDERPLEQCYRSRVVAGLDRDLGRLAQRCNRRRVALRRSLEQVRGDLLRLGLFVGEHMCCAHVRFGPFERSQRRSDRGSHERVHERDRDSGPQHTLRR